ncbi:MAG: DUF1571 domain-containing protein [Gemmataceae bacterium]|nr:DUF1571 domain-containing protein [Gemmataceae bacterium]
MVRCPCHCLGLTILIIGLTVLGCADPSARRREPPLRPESAPSGFATRAALEPTPLRISTPPSAQPSVLPASAQSAPDTQTIVPPPRPNGTATPRQLHALAVQRYAGVDGYVARLRRREQVGGQSQPEELILVKFRRQPWSVYLRWIGKEAHNREMVFVPDQHENLVHILPAPSDPPMPAMAGKRLKMPPDSPLPLARSRYPITETGIGALIDRFGGLLAAAERGTLGPDALRYLGQVRRPEFDAPAEAVLQLVSPGTEKGLPRGGQRFWYFDPGTRFPALVIAQDETGAVVEHYCYDNFLFSPGFRDSDFDPAQLWGR